MINQTTEPTVRQNDPATGITVNKTTTANIPFLEWVMAIIGLVIVTGAISYLVYKGLTEKKTPPQILLKVDSITITGTNYLVQVKAINQGGETVKELMIEGTLNSKGTVIETSTITFDYVPAKSEQMGGLFFTSDPHSLKMQLRALGYEQP